MENMEKNVNVEETKQDLIDPMVGFESEADKNASEQTWRDIWLMCPDTADAITALYKTKRKYAMKDLEDAAKFFTGLTDDEAYIAKSIIKMAVLNDDGTINLTGNTLKPTDEDADGRK